MDVDLDNPTILGTLPPLHPGRVVELEYLEGHGIGADRLAELADTNPARIRALLEGHAGIDAELALRLGKVFGTSPAFWMRMQADYDLRLAQFTRTVDLDRVRPAVLGAAAE